MHLYLLQYRTLCWKDLYVWHSYHLLWPFEANVCAFYAILYVAFVMVSVSLAKRDFLEVTTCYNISIENPCIVWLVLNAVKDNIVSVICPGLHYTFQLKQHSLCAKVFAVYLLSVYKLGHNKEVNCPKHHILLTGKIDQYYNRTNTNVKCMANSCCKSPIMHNITDATTDHNQCIDDIFLYHTMQKPAYIKHMNRK